MTRDINKFKGCLIGGAIGDALGYPIEFVKPSKNDKVTRFDDKGIISDDTQMTLFTANGLLWGQTRFNLRGISPNVSDCIYFAYQDWYKTQSKNKNIETKISWLAELPELNVQRTPGITCLNALSSNKKGTIENPINNSKGCGSVMRVAPIGLFFSKDCSLHEIGKYGAEAGAITHGHPLGIIPCYILTIIINKLAYIGKNIEKAINEAIDEFKANFDIFNKEDSDYCITLIKKAINLAHKKFISDENSIKELGEGWVAEEALAIAIYSSIKYSNDFEKAIICSVNHGGDSDSTGAITGNIIGTYLGIDEIPNYFIDNLELSDVIKEIAEDLYTGCPVNEYSANEDEYWLSKYLYHQRDITKKRL